MKITSHIQQRVTKNALVLLGDRAWLILVRLVEVPLFLAFWGAELWGEWLLLTAMVQYVQLTNIGIGTAGQNEVALAVGGGDEKRALGVMHTIQAALLLLCGVACLVILVLLLGFDLAEVMKLERIGMDEVWLIALAVLFQLVLKLQLVVPYAALSAVGHYPLANLLSLGLAVLEFLPIAILLPLGYGPAELAIVLAAIALVGGVLFWRACLQHVPWARLGWCYASFGIFRSLLRPSLGMFAFNLGTLLNVQGFRIAVGVVLGPAVLAYVVVLRTLGQTLSQFGTVFSFTLRPELTNAHGRRDEALVRRLGRLGVQLSAWASLPLLVGGILAGDWIVSFWTSGRFDASMLSLSLVLTAGCLDVIWRNAMMPAYAANRHNRIALAHVLVFGMGTVLLSYPLAYWMGADGAFVAILVGQLVMVVVVLRLVLPMIGEHNLMAWLRAVTKPPIDVVRRLSTVRRAA